jgi:transcriptional regulator with XRE-family HTH domain
MMSPYLRLVAMPTEDEIRVLEKRRAWWLRVARRGMNQTGVAKALGLSEKSGSTIGDWERGVSQPSLRQLAQLAAIYGVPLETLVNPPMTDEERLDEIVRLAGDAERAGWGEEAAQGQGDGDAPAAARRRRSA